MSTERSPTLRAACRDLLRLRDQLADLDPDPRSAATRVARALDPPLAVLAAEAPAAAAAAVLDRLLVARTADGAPWEHPVEIVLQPLPPLVALVAECDRRLAANPGAESRARLRTARAKLERARRLEDRAADRRLFAAEDRRTPKEDR